MAIAKAEITLSRIVDIASVTRYYKLQSSTVSAPAKPTANPPSDWVTAEPSYTSGSTNTLYFVDQTIFTNGTFSYSAVSKSSSYEAAKAAYNKAQAASDAASDARNVANNNTESVNQVKADLQILNNSIALLVTDKDGSSLMTQTGDGWTFNIGNIQSSLDQTMTDLNTMEGDMASVNVVIGNLHSLTNDLVAKTAYITMTQDSSGDPILELGKVDNPFKVRITNTSIDFMDGSTRVAYISNQKLYIQSSVVTDEMQIGESPGWVWNKRPNGNLGLRWKP